MDDSLGPTVIVAPPGSAKTMTMVGACGWWLGRDPTLHIAYICNEEGAARERSNVLKALIEGSDNYRAIFPEVVPDKDRGWSQTEWFLKRPVLTDKNPTFIAVGVGGGIIGNRLDRAVIDDIADVENMKTDQQRRSLQLYLEQNLMTRFIGSKVARPVMISTRWHVDDPAAWAAEKGWHVVKIPALDEEGESYWPEERPAAQIKCPGEHDPLRPCCMWKQLGGERNFQLVMMGNVVSDETALFKRTNWREYQQKPETHRGGIFVDLAHTEKTQGDETAMLAASTDGSGRYLEHLIHARMEFPEAESTLRALRGAYPYPIYIEDTPGSKPLIQRLQRELWGVIPWRHHGRSKLARAEAAAPSHEAGNWHLPAPAPWKGYLVEQAAAFPYGQHDDCVDVTTMMELTFQTRGQQQGKQGKRHPFKRAWQKIAV
jgi:predicted phage terminase large subunit-like protein